MFGISSIEKGLENEIDTLLKSAAFDSPKGLKAQSRYLLLQSQISLRTGRYTFWTVVILALSFIVDVILRIIELARCF